MYGVKRNVVRELRVSLQTVRAIAVDLVKSLPFVQEGQLKVAQIATPTLLPVLVPPSSSDLRGADVGGESKYVRD